MYKRKFFSELHRGDIFAAINVFYNIPDIYIKTDVVIDDFGKCLDAATITGNFSGEMTTFKNKEKVLVFVDISQAIKYVKQWSGEDKWLETL